MKTKASILALTTLVLAACALERNDGELADGSEAALGAGGAPGESHPYQSRLICERKQGSILVGVMYDISSGSKVKVTEISSNGNVGACELSIRAARNKKVCIPGSSGWTVRDLSTNTNAGAYTKLSACTAITRGSPQLRTEPGYVDIIAPSEMAPFRAALPTLADATIDAALKDAKTIWYDESALVFTYQDSFGSPKGLRANRVGFDVGNTASEPDIHALVEYFQPSKFKFPFAFSAGATFEDNVYVLNFWRPPTSNAATGAVKPVKIWKNASHWQWVFPVGTTIGEVLFIQAPDDKSWYALEVRSRVRAIDRWVTGVFRPYVHATDLASAIKEKRPTTWETSTDLRALVAAAESTETLTAATLSSPSYQAIFPAMQGALDYLPATTDTALIKELLTGRTFSNAMGERWKTNAAGTLKTYAASTKAGFHIVPRDYKGGMLESSGAACRKCHEQTSRPLNNLDGRVVLYGEVWGEDEVFTWHPFAISEDSFSVGDGTRFVNQRLVTSGLVEMAPSASSALSDPVSYKALPKPYVTQYE